MKEPKIIQIVKVDNVKAIYKQDDGSEEVCPVQLVALFDDGNIQFMNGDCEGFFSDPGDVSNFVRYDFA